MSLHKMEIIPDNRTGEALDYAVSQGGKIFARFTIMADAEAYVEDCEQRWLKAVAESEPPQDEYAAAVVGDRLRVSVPGGNAHLWYDIDSPIVALALETLIEGREVSPQEIVEYADQHGLGGLYDALVGPMIDNLQTMIESASEPYGMPPVSGEGI